MATEYLYVDGELPDLGDKGWTTHTGAAPYLNDSILNSITTFTTDQIDKDFTFANTSGAYVWGDITAILLELECKTTSEFVGAHAALDVGAGYVEKGNYGFDAADWNWQSVNVLATFANLAQIDACTMRLTSHRTGASASVSIRRGRLTITYTVAGQPYQSRVQYIPGMAKW